MISVFFGTLTFANDLRVMTRAYEIYKDLLSDLKANATGDWNFYIVFQAIPPAYWQDSEAQGGNVLGLERFNKQVLCRESLYSWLRCDLLMRVAVILPYISWQGAEQDVLFQAAGAELIRQVRKYAESIGADNPYL